MLFLSTGKKTGIVIGTLVALAVIGFGAVHYIESSTVEMVQTLINEYSKINKTEVGSVSYSLLGNKLELKDIKIQTTDSDTTEDISIARIEIDGLNRSLGAIMNAPGQDHAMVEVADEMTVYGYTNTITFTHPVFGKEMRLNCESQRLKDLRADAAFLAGLKSASMKTEEFSLALTYSTAYAESATTDAAIVIVSAPQVVTVTISSITAKGYDKGLLKEALIKDTRVKTAEKERASCALVRLADVTAPPREVMKTVSNFDEKELGKELSDEEALALLRSIFFGEHPLVGLLEVTDLKINKGPVSLKNFTFKNPTTHPFTVALQMDNLVFPVKDFPRLAQLSLLGYKQIDISQTFELSLPEAGGSLKVSGACDVKDMLKGSMLLEGDLPGGSADLEERWAAFKVSLLELNYTDEGLLPRAAAANKRLTGMAPGAGLQLFENALRSEAGNDTRINEELIKKIMEFIRKPGSLRVAIKPAQPLTFEELSQLPAASSILTLTVEPGKQTLEQGAEAVLKSLNESAQPTAPAAQ